MSAKVVEVRVVTHGGPAVTVLVDHGDGQIKSTQAPWVFGTNAEAEAFAEGIKSAVELMACGYTFDYTTKYSEPVGMKRINFT